MPTTDLDEKYKEISVGNRIVQKLFAWLPRWYSSENSLLAGKILHLTSKIEARPDFFGK